MLNRRPTVLSCVLVWGLYACVVLFAQQPQAPTPEDLTNQIELKLDETRRLNDQLRTMLQPCSYAVAPATVPSVQATGATLTFQVTTTGQSCGWSVVAADPWVSPSTSSGTDSGTATVLVSGNAATTPRSTTVTIAGVIVPLQQDAAAVTPPTNVVKTAQAFTAALAARLSAIRVEAQLTGNWTIDYGPLTIDCPTAVAAGIRTTPQNAVGGFVASDKFKSPIAIANNGQANDITIRGCSFTGVDPSRSLFHAGDVAEPDVAKLPRNLTLDRNDFLGVNGLGHRAVDVHAANVVFTNNHVSGFLERYRQSQGFYSANGPGPFLIEGNYIEASGENILFGGDDPRVQGLIPSDIVIRGNLLYKPLASYPPNSVVNLLELKNAQRVVIEDNVLDGSRVDVQAGNALTFTPRNQYGKAPWTTVRDVVVRRNTIKNYEGYGAQHLYTDNNSPSGRLTNITYEGNLWLGLRVLIMDGIDGDLRFTNNTHPNVTDKIIAFNGPVPATGAGAPRRPNFYWTKNVGLTGKFGILGQSGTGGQGTPSINGYTTPIIVTGNVLEQGTGTVYQWQRLPSGNTFLNTPGQLAPLLDPAYHYTPDPNLGW